MNYTSTRDQTQVSTFKEAIFHGLAPDGGLYIPTHTVKIATIPETITLPTLGKLIMSHYIDDMTPDQLDVILQTALNFPIPLVQLDQNVYLLEVFHGPTLAFKDVGARFMAQTLSHYLQIEHQHITILVATSGDTGSAIANAFHLMPNIDVFVLYPSNKISFLQEQQMTTLGDNIHALEVDGTFDDCQRLVKSALNDAKLKQQLSLTTANSINIARLLPQMIYHSFGICQLQQLEIDESPVLVVPSGNFGNLTSAIYAHSLGFPVHSFIAATNINAIVPNYLATGIFTPKPSQQSYSNAMDVGNPSNFERLTAFFHQDLKQMRAAITGISISNEETLAEIRRTYERTGYILDPHTAVGVAAARSHQSNHPIIITATAHPAKFPEVIQRAIDIEAPMPDRLKLALNGKKQATHISPTDDALRAVLRA